MRDALVSFSDCVCLLCAGLDQVHYMILLDSKYATNMIRESRVHLGCGNVFIVSAWVLV